MKKFTGDSGETGLCSGRVSKSDRRVAACGDIDELTSFIGLAKVQLIDRLSNWLKEIQKDLFDIGADLANDSKRLNDTRVKSLEDEVKRLEGELPPLRNFILPGGTPSAAILHVARSVCRRAERTIVDVEHANKELTMKYMNRLNYLLFLFARKENTAAGIEDEHWES